MTSTFGSPDYQPPAPDLKDKPLPTDLQYIMYQGTEQEKPGAIDDSYVLRCKIMVNRPDGWIEFPLWLNTGVEDMPDFAVVEGIHIEWGPGIAGSITINTRMDYEMGRWFLDNEVSRFMNVLVVQMGYPKANLWTPIFYGYMEAPQPSHDPMGYSITLTAKLIGRRIGQLRYNLSEHITGARTRRDVISSFFKEQGYDVYFYLDAITAREEPNEWLDAEVETGLLSGGRFWPESSSIEGLVDWVCMEAGMRCIMWPHPDTGHIYALSFINLTTIYKEKIAKDLRLFSGVDIAQNIYPLTAFQCDSPQVFYDRWTMGAKADDIDPLTKEEVTVQADESTTDLPAVDQETQASRAGETDAEKTQTPVSAEVPPTDAPTGTTASEVEFLAEEALEAAGRLDPFAPDPNVKLPYDAGKDVAPSGVQIAAPAGRDETEKSRLQSVYDEKYTKNIGIKAMLTTIGMPDAFPEMKIRVGRVGSRFDGVYHAHKIIHDVAGLWNTSFEAVKHEFSKGSGELKTSRPLLPPEKVGAAFPAYPTQGASEEAAGDPGDDGGAAGEEAV